VDQFEFEGLEIAADVVPGEGGAEVLGADVSKEVVDGAGGCAVLGGDVVQVAGRVVF